MLSILLRKIVARDNYFGNSGASMFLWGGGYFGNSKGIWSQGSEGTPLGRWRLLAVSNQGEYLLQKRHIDKKDSFFSNFLYT